MAAPGRERFGSRGVIDTSGVQGSALQTVNGGSGKDRKSWLTARRVRGRDHTCRGSAAVARSNSDPKSRLPVRCREEAARGQSTRCSALHEVVISRTPSDLVMNQVSSLKHRGRHRFFEGRSAIAVVEAEPKQRIVSSRQARSARMAPASDPSIGSVVRHGPDMIASLRGPAIDSRL